MRIVKTLKVTYIRRKSSAFSIEKITNILTESLENDIIYSEIFALSKFEKPFSILKNLVHFFCKLNIKRPKSDIYHITGVLHYLFPIFIFLLKKTILTIHDCIKYHQNKGLRKWIVKQIWFKLPTYFFKYITVVSHQTKKELVQITGCNPAKIKVIYNPLDPDIHHTYKAFNQTYPTILHIGTDHNKNVYRLINALKGIPCHLIIIGKINEGHKKQFQINNINYSNLFNLSDNEIREQYRQCDIVSFITLYEGFGLPIIEAQASGKAVITSKIEPHKEIGSDGAYYVDPLNVEEMHNGILKLIQDKNLRQMIIENGKKNIVRFEAKTIAKQYLDLYNEVVTDKIKKGDLCAV